MVFTPVEENSSGHLISSLSLSCNPTSCKLWLVFLEDWNLNFKELIKLSFWWLANGPLLNDNFFLFQGIEATDIGSLLEQFLEYEKGEYYKNCLQGYLDA